MSKALSTIGKVAGIVASVAAFIPGGQPIAAIAASIAVVANVGSQLTAKKPPTLGSASEITIGADQSTPYWIGDTYGGGALVHRVGYGPTQNKVPNPYLAMAIVYSAGGPIAGFDQFTGDFDPIGFSGGNATGYFHDYLYQSVSLGATPQAAALTGQWGAIPDWGADAKLSGKAHVLWSAKWDAKNGKFSSGLPQLGARGRGVLTWDPRADSTWPGGVGPQRWADPADTAAFAAVKPTWAYTARPGLHALRYALGTWEQGPDGFVLTFGIGIPIDGVVVEDFVALENVCDANGWEVSGELLEPGDKMANLKRILAAGGAEPSWKGGRLGLKLSTPRVALDTITRDDLADGDIRVPGMLAWRDRINTVIPKYKSPAHKWTLQESTKIKVAAWVAEDGEEKPREIAFEYVKDVDQAAKLATLQLWDAREAGPIELPIKPRLRGYHGGDKLVLDEALRGDLGLAEASVVVVQRSFDPMTMTGVLTVMTETAAKHAAAGVAGGTVPPAITILTPEERDGQAADLMVPPRAAHAIVDQTVAFPVSSTATSISIAAFSATIDDGRTIALPAATFAGLAADSAYVVFRDLIADSYVLPAEGSATPFFESDRYVVVRRYRTQLSGGGYTPPTTSGGGDGGSGPNPY